MEGEGGEGDPIEPPCLRVTFFNFMPSKVKDYVTENTFTKCLANTNKNVLKNFKEGGG